MITYMLDIFDNCKCQYFFVEIRVSSHRILATSTAMTNIYMTKFRLSSVNINVVGDFDHFIVE